MNFNQPIGAVVWRPSLQQLTFGLLFDQPIIDREAFIPAISPTAHLRGAPQPAHPRGQLATAAGAADLQVLPLETPLRCVGVQTSRCGACSGQGRSKS